MREPRAGDYGIVRTGGFFGWLIRLGTLSKWNHAFIVVGDGTFIEANPKGVQIVSGDRYPQAVYNTVDEISDEDRAKIVGAARSYLGRPYGWLDIAALTLTLFGLNTHWVTARVSRQDRMICSQVVAQAYADADLPLFPFPPYLVRPADLANRLIEES